METSAGHGSLLNALTAAPLRAETQAGFSRMTPLRHTPLVLLAVALSGAWTTAWPGHAGGASRLPAATPHIPDIPRADVGRIFGNVVISSALTAKRPRFRIYTEAGPGAVPPPPPRSDIPSELRNVVVYLGGNGRAGSDLAQAGTIAAATLDSMRRGVMAQTQERFEPHVLSLLQDGRVDFPNRDDVYHNVFSLSRVKTFDLGRYPTGSSKSVTFTKPGVVQVFCHIHSDMSGIVFVLPNPFFARPDTVGSYAIDDIPVGDYTIVGWHERTKPVSLRVHVAAGQTTRVDFNLPLERPPEP
jgi:plastocyanin